MKKFLTLLEGNFRRYQGSSFLSGDIVKFKKDVMNHEWSKGQAGNLIEKLKRFTESDLNLRVSSVQATRPAVQGQTQQDNQVCDYYCDVVQETAPNRWHEFITVPSYLLELNNPDFPNDPNLAPIPDSTRYKDQTHIKPVQSDDPGKLNGDTTKPDSQTRYTDRGISGSKTNNMEISDWKLPQENRPMSHGKKWDDKSPGGGNYPRMSVYMENLKD
jgi:hypothetical protein